MVTVYKRLEVCADWLDAKNWRLILVLGAWNTFFLAFASRSTSPLNPYYGADAAGFMLFGKSIVNGFVPYLDLYDHKGPLLFFLNALGYWIYEGKLGVFCLQIVFFTIVLFFLYKIARLLIEAKYALLIELVFCYYYFTLVQGGNLSEEWSLLFNVVPMYLAMRFLMSHDMVTAHPLRYSLVYGICLSAQVLIRLNNASILCGIILAFMILLLHEKAYGTLFANAGFVLLGMGVVVLPFVCYFVVNDAFSFFIQAAYIDNFIYAFDGFEKKDFIDLFVIVLRLLLYPVSVFAGWCLYKAKQLKGSVFLLIVCMGSVSAPLLFLGYGYLHYFLTFAPIMMLALVLACKVFFAKLVSTRSNILGLIFVLCIAVLPFWVLFLRQGWYTFRVTFLSFNDPEVSSVEQVMQHIPQGEYDSVLSYDVAPRFYLYAEVLPCNRFFAWQSFQAIAAPQNATEIGASFKTDAPLWVVTEKPAAKIPNEILQDVLQSEYILVDEADYGLGLYLYQKQ